MARKSGSNGEKTAKELRSAATELFAQHGYAAVSMRQIAAEIGVQAGALYLYTPDKQALLFDLMRDHMQELLQAWEVEAATIGTDPAVILDRFVRFHIRFHIRRVDEVFIAYMELRNLNPENLTIITDLRQKYENQLSKILIAGVEQKIFDIEDVKLATFAIIAMLTGINTWFRSKGPLSSEMVEGVYSKMVARVVSGIDQP